MPNKKALHRKYMQRTGCEVQESADLDKATADESSDRSGVEAELNAVMEYLATLHKRCIVTGDALGTSAESYVVQ